MNGPLPRLLALWCLSAAVVGAAASCAGSATPQCGDSNCNGCCSAEGECVGFAKQTVAACGLSGNECSGCPTGRVCKNGRCGTIDDGGTEGEDSGTDLPDSGSESCGANGELCCAGSPECFFGLTCQNGFCSAPPEDSGTVVCGGRLEACCATGAACQGAFTCQSGFCDDPPVAVVSKPVGATCSVNGECDAGTCELTFPDGYCSKGCTTNTQCPAGSRCGTRPTSGNLCLDSCTPAGQIGAAAGCRTGYVCEKSGSSIDRTAVCYPGCASTSDCGGTECDSRGFCCGAPGKACCEGSTCSAGAACDAGYCQTGTATKSPVGAACTDAGQCTDNTCVPQTTTASATLWPNGYCTRKGCETAACPSGSGCSYLGLKEDGGDRVCMNNCAFDGGRGNCRSGYICDNGWQFATPNQAACMYRCEAAVDCGGARRCDSRGFCCGADGFACCSEGGACNAGLSCVSGVCQ